MKRKPEIRKMFYLIDTEDCLLSVYCVCSIEKQISQYLLVFLHELKVYFVLFFKGHPNCYSSKKTFIPDHFDLLSLHTFKS